MITDRVMSDRLSHYLTLWDLSSPQLIVETPRGHIYRVVQDGVTVVLKILTDEGAEEQHGAVALRWFAGQGAVWLRRHDEGAHLLEYVDGDELAEQVKRGDDDEAAVIIAQVLNQLHSVEQPEHPPEGLTPLKTWFRYLFAKARADEQAGEDTIFRRGAAVAEALFRTERDVRVLHGDVHPHNIRLHMTRGWLAYDPKGLYGERTYDAANTLYNPAFMPNGFHTEARLLRIVDILAIHAGMDRKRLMAFIFAYGCLSVSWSLSVGEDPTHWLTIAQQAEMHVVPPEAL